MQQGTSVNTTALIIRLKTICMWLHRILGSSVHCTKRLYTGHNYGSPMSIQFVKIGAVVLGYWTISISMVFANKYLVNDRQSTEGVPLFVAWIQCIITVFVIFALNTTKAAMSGDWSKIQISKSMVLNPSVMIMSLCFVSMLSFNNMCLKYVGVAFYQVARSTTLIFTVVFSITILKKMVSVRVIGCCVIVACGFILGVDQEKFMGTLSIRGVVYGVISSLFVSLTGIFTKKALDVVEGDSVKLTLCSHINAIVLFCPIVIATGQLSSVIRSPSFHELYFWAFLITTGGLSFLIAWISAVQINLTSPVTHHISGNTKAVLQTVLAVFYFHEHKALLWWVSILLVVGGAFAYAIVRIREDQHDKAIKQEPDNMEKGMTRNGTLKA